jgi:hypothetical protein
MLTPQGAQPWRLLDNEAMSLRLSIEDDSLLLSEIAETFQGIKTGANSIFVVELIEEIDARRSCVRDGLGAEFEIEQSILRPVVYGADIQRYGLLRPRQFLIYPYLNNKVIPKDRFENEFPAAYSHLIRRQDALSSRKSIKATGRAWYELSWERSDQWLSQPKLVCRELAQRATVAIDDMGGVFVIGGTSVIPSEQAQLLPLLAYLNSQLADWYLRVSTPTFQSRYAKFESQHLRTLPVPRVLLEDQSVREQLADFAQKLIAAAASEDSAKQGEVEDRLDHFVASSIGIDLDILT